MLESHPAIEKLKFSPSQTLLFYPFHFGFELNLSYIFMLNAQIIFC